MEIRPTTRTDIPAVDALLSASYPVLLNPDYPASVLVTALPLISRAQPDLVACGTYFGLWDSALVAAGGWTEQAPGAGGVEGVPQIGHIRHVVTDHRATRRGYGRALMVHILQSARGAGITEMRCQATLSAVAFYQAMGFRAQEPIDVPLRQGITFPAVLMRQALL